MAELSIPWGGTVLGDSGPYSDDDWSDLWNALFCVDRTTQGYIDGILNDLAVSGVASPVTVGSGAALVDGKYYRNTANSSVVIPTPAGDTRIDRIVLRKSWAAQTIRITRIAGVEGGAAPAITQNDGTTWDVSLAQVSITVGGVITVTDERDPCADPRSKLVNDSSPTLGATLDCDDNKIDNVGDFEFNDGGAIVDIIRDEDDMASDDANALATQQSIKKYVDDSILRIYNGNYTGDGTESNGITGVGFQPVYVEIWSKQTDTQISSGHWTWPAIMDDDVDGGAIFHSFSDGIGYFYDNQIISLDADGFTVDDAGTDANPNANTQVYNFMCIGPA